MEEISIISYNSRGFGNCKQDFVKLLTKLTGNVHTILCNQENFLLRNNDYLVKQTLPDHHVVFKPAVKNSLEGRPKGGLFMAVPLKYKDKVEDVSPDSFRIQCIILSLPSTKLLLINTYFPTDPKGDFDENELLLLLADIRRLLEEKNFDSVIWLGDINADFRRTTKFVGLVSEFIDEHGIIKSWDKHEVDFTHLTVRDEQTYTSTIDHFFWDETCDKIIKEAGVLHHPDNMSDHSPIFCKINVSDSETSQARNPIKSKATRPIWRLASDEEKLSFHNEIDTQLQEISLPLEALNCTNTHCKNESHIRMIDDLMENVLMTLESSAKHHIPTPPNQCPSKSKSRDMIPNWKSDIQPYKDNAYFWFSVWLSAGKPINCQLHSIMKRTRNQYHLLIRRSKRLLQNMKKNNLLNSCLENDTSIFDEIKKQRKCKQTPVSTIDGHTHDIPDYLAEKYENLYNGVDDAENLTKLEAKLNDSISQHSCTHANLLNPDVIRSASRKLKTGKTDPIFSITSDYLMHGPQILYEILSFCLQSFIIHGHVSKILLISTMIPLVKNKLGDLTSSNNYRSIAISSLILKIFDLAIISVFKNNLILDDLQFGYQSEVSTSMCTFLAVETIDYFQRNNSDVYSCLMDMSKAFDTVQHSVLFQKLLDQGMPEIIVRYLFVSYRNQKANVKWANEKSDFFSIKNGVKQGAILSAVLYCVYTNGIFQELRRLNIGCKVGDAYVGVIGYADDLLLMCPTLDGLQQMLNICEKYASTHNLKFSTDTNPQKSKTKCIGFLIKDRELPLLKLCGNELPWVKNGKHLGMKLENSLGKILNQDILEKRAQYIQRNNELMQEFSFASTNTKFFINQIFNTSFYGSVLWDLQCKEANMIYNSWSASIRIMLGIDRKAHRYLIEPLSEQRHIKTSLKKRFLKFTKAMSMSKKTTANYVYEFMKFDCRSITGSNHRQIMLECKKMHVDLVLIKDVEKLVFQQIQPLDTWRLGFLKELLDMRDRGNTIKWKKKEVQEVIDYVCTS